MNYELTNLDKELRKYEYEARRRYRQYKGTREKKIQYIASKYTQMYESNVGMKALGKAELSKMTGYDKHRRLLILKSFLDSSPKITELRDIINIFEKIKEDDETIEEMVDDYLDYAGGEGDITYIESNYMYQAVDELTREGKYESSTHQDIVKLAKEKKMRYTMDQIKKYKEDINKNKSYARDFERNEYTSMGGNYTDNPFINR